MPKLIPALAAGVAAVAIAFTPAVSATAATHPASAPKHYTLSVTGDGKHATVVWTTLTVKKGSVSGKPTVHTVPKAHEPWKKTVSAGADLYEIAAVQTTGSTLSCTIKDTKGKVVAKSFSTGKNTIVTCIVTKSSLLAGAGMGMGGGSGSGSGSGSSQPVS